MTDISQKKENEDKIKNITILNEIKKLVESPPPPLIKLNRIHSALNEGDLGQKTRLVK